MANESFQSAAKRVLSDLIHLRNLEIYAVAALAYIFAITSVVGDVIPEGPRWGVLLAGVGLLVYRLSSPRSRRPVSMDEILRDRSFYERIPFEARIRTANEIWIFAPSAINVLSPQHCDALRANILSRADGIVKIVVLDPLNEEAVQTAVRHLDDSLDRPMELFRSSLQATMRQLERMDRWTVNGNFEYRLLGFNPGFSLVAINPTRRNGVVLIETHGFYQEMATSRMHVEISRSESERWHMHWVEQFNHIWQASRPA